MNIEYRMSKEGPSEMDCRISRDKYLTISIHIKNQSEAIPPFVIRYSSFKKVITATVSFKSISLFGSPINRDPPKADKFPPHGPGGQARFATTGLSRFRGLQG